MTATVCDTCFETALEMAATDLDIEAATDLMVLIGADAPDHECETWTYGGRPCPCACHPQTAAAERKERRRLGVSDTQGQHERGPDWDLESQYEDRYGSGE